MKGATLAISYTLGTIDSAAEKLWAFARDYRIWAFAGDMGAGKTTLISSLCHYLGVNETPSSPTFSLINEYRWQSSSGTEMRILHMDWYRLNDTAEAIDAGIEDALNSGHYCFVEWPENAANLLSKGYIHININTLSPTERSLQARVQT